MKIEVKEGKETVNARELHSFLESKQDFSTWIKNRIEKYGFIIDSDFTNHKFVERGATKIDYYISIDMAKELSMVENNDRGREARRWFISREKQVALMADDPIIGMRLRQIETEKKLQRVEEQVNQITPSPGFYTVLAYARRMKLRIDNNRAQRIGIRASKLCNERGITPGYVPDARFGEVRAYPEEILEEVVYDERYNR